MTKLLALVHGVAVATLVSLPATAAAKPTDAKPITMQDAERIALKRVPGGTIDEIEKDRHAGRDVFEVEVRAPDGREHDLVIDALDGRVVSEEIDD
jgi:uncharacterized membrane protein YkoI